MSISNETKRTQTETSVHELCRPPPLILYPTHGFANRLRFIASGVIWIRRMEDIARTRVQIPVWVIWKSTPDCNINVGDFLHIKSGGVNGVWFLDADADCKKISVALNRATKQSVPYFSNNILNRVEKNLNNSVKCLFDPPEPLLIASIRSII